MANFKGKKAARRTSRKLGRNKHAPAGSKLAAGAAAGVLTMRADGMSATADSNGKLNLVLRRTFIPMQINI